MKYIVIEILIFGDDEIADNFSKASSRVGDAVQYLKRSKFTKKELSDRNRMRSI